MSPDPSTERPDIGPRMLLAFDGPTPPPWLTDVMASSDVAGVTLFRASNIVDPEQTRKLTATLQSSRGGTLPLLIAVDQEGGQLRGAGAGTTAFPGNMAVGATGDPALARRVASATGRELAALGINVDYAPVCDIASNQANPSLGIRSFGADPERVAALSAATVSGLAEAGIAAVAKHFPGKGEATIDPHWALPSLSVDAARLESFELVPFRAAMSAGASMLMVGHYDVPAITGAPGTPTSVSRDAVWFARSRLGFDGVVITDAMDMHALGQGAESIVEAIAALAAGVDVLLCVGDASSQQALRAGLARALQRGLIAHTDHDAAVARIAALREHVEPLVQPDLDVVGCAAHADLAAEAAARALTLVRDGAVLPLSPGPDDTVVAVIPEPRDLTPADTSSAEPAALGDALRRHHGRTVEVRTRHSPTSADIEAVRRAAAEARYVVVATIDAWANPAQAALVDSVLDLGGDVVTVAVRNPHDLVAYPGAPTYACTYGIVEPSLGALAAALFGAAGFPGTLPAPIPGLYPTGHGVRT